MRLRFGVVSPNRFFILGADCFASKVASDRQRVPLTFVRADRRDDLEHQRCNPDHAEQQPSDAASDKSCKTEHDGAHSKDDLKYQRLKCVKTNELRAIFFG